MKLLMRKESTRYPGLFVKKYTRKVFYDNLWNDELIEARGHVETEDGRIVVRPFTKIFNRGENAIDINRDETCVVVNKVNGFMAAVTWVPEVCDVIVSTTGSLDSDFVAIAEKYITNRVRSYVKSMINIDPGTYLFEIVDPSDPHIIPEKTGAYLIGFRPFSDPNAYFSTEGLETSLDKTADAMGVYRSTWSVKRFSDIVQEAKVATHEGFVVYGQTSKTVLKIKTPHYLTLKAIARRKDIMTLNKAKIDEEFYPLVDHIVSMGDDFTQMDEQARLEYMRNFLNGR